MAVSLIGIDLGKRVFQVCALNRNGKVVFNRQVNRGRIAETLQQIPPTVVAMESCATSNYWGHRFQQMGHEVQLVPPQHVKPFLKGKSKSDKRDALAICEASRRPQLHYVPLKTQAQQDLQMLIRYREQIVSHRTACANQIRGFLAESGVVLPVGLRRLRSELPRLLCEPSDDLSEVARYTLLNLSEQLTEHDEREQRAYSQLKQCVMTSAQGQLLLKIPGFGLIVSAHWLAAVGDGAQFKNGRQCAAWLGLVPEQAGSGGKIYLSSISKNGNRQLRTQLIHGARAVISWRHRREDPMTQWASRIVAQQGQDARKAIVALANKMARIAWAVSRSGEPFDMNKAARR